MFWELLPKSYVVLQEIPRPGNCAHLSLVNIHSDSAKEGPLEPPVNERRSQGLEKFSNLPKVTQLETWVDVPCGDAGSGAPRACPPRL